MESIKEFGLIGLGKMGLGLALNANDKGYKVHAWNRSEEVVKIAEESGVVGEKDIESLIESLPSPKVVWLMLPSGEVTNNMIEKVLGLLSKGDILIDGANSNYKNSQKNSLKCTDKSVKFLDIGVSGGPGGARNGACMMCGGDKSAFEFVENLVKDLCVEGGYGYFGNAGSGHFVKMVHNGIEYGMMQAIGEGFNLMKNNGEYDLDLKKVTGVYNHGSVITSSLVGWLEAGYKQYGVELEDISGKVSHSGEGLWTVETAEEKGLEVENIKQSLNFRIKSQESPSYTGQVVSVLRNMFGGHNVDHN